MDGSFLSSTGSGFMVEKALVPDGVTDFETGAARECDPGSARSAVKVQEDVEALPPDRSEEIDEFAAALFGGHDQNAIDIGMTLDKPAIGFLDQIGQGGLRKMPLDEGDGGCRQDDIAETAQSDQKNGAGVQAGNNSRETLSLLSF
jgi:hypothetical protein